MNSPDKSLSKIYLETDVFKDTESESFLEDAKHLDGIINQASREALEKVNSYVELDADYFEPFLTKTETVERTHTPSRIYMKIIDKILDDPELPATSINAPLRMSTPEDITPILNLNEKYTDNGLSVFEQLEELCQKESAVNVKKSVPQENPDFEDVFASPSKLFI